MTTALGILLGALLGSSFIAILRYAQAGRLRPAPAAAPFRTVPPGTRWLRCDTTRCAHLTTRHTPQPDGAYQCTECEHTVGGAQ